jgi:hypothetical protein
VPERLGIFALRAELPEGLIGYLMCGIAQSEDPNEIVLSVCRMRKPK